MESGIEITKRQEYKIEKMLENCMRLYSGRIRHEYFSIRKSAHSGNVYVTLISIVSASFLKSVLTQSFTIGARGKVRHEKSEMV